MQDLKSPTVSDLSYNPSMKQDIYGNGLKVFILHSHPPWDKKLPRRKDISGHEWVTLLRRCCILVQALSVCAIYGNKMELCRILHNCIMSSREKALAEDTTGIGRSLPRCHGFLCPYVSKWISRASSDSSRLTLGGWSLKR